LLRPVQDGEESEGGEPSATDAPGQAPDVIDVIDVTDGAS